MREMIFVGKGVPVFIRTRKRFPEWSIINQVETPHFVLNSIFSLVYILIIEYIERSLSAGSSESGRDRLKSL